MWEVTNRLRALYVGQIADGGDEDPAIIAMGALDDEVEAIDPTDVDAQRAKISELRHRHEQLIGR